MEAVKLRGLWVIVVNKFKNKNIKQITQKNGKQSCLFSHTPIPTSELCSEIKKSSGRNCFLETCKQKNIWFGKIEEKAATDITITTLLTVQRVIFYDKKAGNVVISFF